MGLCAEKTARDLKITREDNDEYCHLSYQRTLKSMEVHGFRSELIPLKMKTGAIVLFFFLKLIKILNTFLLKKIQKH